MHFQQLSNQKLLDAGLEDGQNPMKNSQSDKIETPKEKVVGYVGSIKKVLNSKGKAVDELSSQSQNDKVLTNS